MLARLDHSRREDALRAIERGKGLAQAGHLAADRGLAFHEHDLVAGIGDIERRLDAGHAAANNQGPAGQGDLDRGQGMIVSRLGHGHRYQVDRLGGGQRAVVMDPRALFADVGHFDQVGIQTFLLGRLAEGVEVHVRRAGGHDDAGEMLGGDLLANRGLAGFRTHVLAGHGAGDARQLAGRGRDLFDIDGAGDVLAAPTNKYADSGHGSLLLHALAV